jgi:hypothetical protein
MIKSKAKTEHFKDIIRELLQNEIIINILK